MSEVDYTLKTEKWATEECLTGADKIGPCLRVHLFEVGFRLDRWWLAKRADDRGTTKETRQVLSAAVNDFFEEAEDLLIIVEHIVTNPPSTWNTCQIGEPLEFKETIYEELRKQLFRAGVSYVANNATDTTDLVELLRIVKPIVQNQWSERIRLRHMEFE